MDLVLTPDVSCFLAFFIFLIYIYIYIWCVAVDFLCCFFYWDAFICHLVLPKINKKDNKLIKDALLCWLSNQTQEHQITQFCMIEEVELNICRN
jgi:hypothetical protein